jgi:OOP family OmpA-OmpF porin
MKRITALALSEAIALIVSSAWGADGDNSPGDVGSWYISPLLQYHLKGNDPELKDDFAYQAGVGVNLPYEFAIEGDFNRGTFDIKGTDATRRQTGYSIDVIKKFFPEDIMQRWMIQPYALIGGGELDDDTSAPGYNPPTFHTWLAEAGIGLLTGIGSQQGPTRVQLRTEAKYRVEFANPSRFGVQDPSGLIFGLGLQINFGNRDERPPVIREVVREVPVAAPPAPPPPAPPPPPPPAPRGEIRLQGVTFATNSAELIPESDVALDGQVRQFQQYPNLVIEVRGYTDSRGSAEYNLNLSQRRAETVMSYLKAHGVTNPMTAKGYGKSDPIADNSTKDGQLANRRVTLNVSGGNDR